MPIVKILKDGKELLSITIPDEFEIRVIPATTGTATQVTHQPAVQPTSATELAVAIPPVPKPPEPEPARAELKPREVKASEEKEVSKIMEAAISRAEETSRKLMEATREREEKKEDISLIRKVIEQLVE